MGKLLIFFLSLLATTFPSPVSLSSLREETPINENSIFNLSKLEMFVDELPDMPTLLGYGVDYNGSFVAGNLIIGMYQKFWKFHRDLPATSVFAYGDSEAAATVPGPTIESTRGIPTYVTWTNHLPSKHILPWDPTIPTARPASGVGVPTVVHLHGGVHPPTSDGNSYAWFTAGFATLGPTFAGATAFYPNRQPPGNLWYHDHAMGLTRANLLAGLVGSYTIRSPDLEDRLGLPSGREFDRRLVLFDRSFRPDGSLFMNATGNNPSIHPQWQPEYFGAAVIVNGKAWPFLIVRRRRYRFRILNASNARFYGLYFVNDDRLSFRHVGSDANYLARPVTSRRFVLAPSEIADVVIDFAESSADAVVLGNDAPYPYPSGDPTDALNGQVMKFLIRGGRGESDPSRVPALLAPELPAPKVGQATKRRYIAMYEYVSAEDEPTHLYLNAQPYEAPATETPAEGSSEVWEVINLTDDNHPLHVHLAVFVVLEQRELHGKDAEELRQCMQKKNDAVACGAEEMAARGRLRPVPAHEQGWKNVFKMMPGAVTRVLLRFAPLEGGAFIFDPTAEPGYVYHCHILDHEDNEMMRPLKLVH